jgi:translocation and assembly module TamA
LRTWQAIPLILGLLMGPAGAARALEQLQFQVAGSDTGLRADLRARSAVVAAHDAQKTDSSEILAAALSDYRILTETLYANGYYSGVVNVLVDGREAASLALLAPPARIGTVAVRVDPGRPFRFGQVRVGPAPEGAQLTPLRPGERAESTRIKDAVGDTVDAWREVGFAKARPVSERVVADHPNATLDAEVGIDPGPRVQFGDLIISTPSAVRADRIRRIAGFPSGTVFSPEALQTVATRLRRTGAFSSVTLTEAEALGPNAELDVALGLADQAPRRFGFGAELSSLEGLELSGFWLHRNLLGGAERLRFDAVVANIGGQNNGIDWVLRTRFEVPAVFGPDTTLFSTAELGRLDEPSFTANGLVLGIGASKTYTETFQAEAQLAFRYAETSDDLGERAFTLVTAPVSAVWDRRDDPLSATAGTYLAATATPFLGLDGAASGLRGTLDARAYRSLGALGGAEDGVVLATRLQLGTVASAGITETHPDFLFYSGGGTVRGQPYQSLNVDLGGGTALGGRSFLGLSAEIRAAVTERIGAVAFADAGYIGAESFYDGSGAWPAGAGLGLRYDTGLGRIRFDVAAPVSGDTGDGVQLYLGIGQAF